MLTMYLPRRWNGVLVVWCPVREEYGCYIFGRWTSYAKLVAALPANGGGL